MEALITHHDLTLVVLALVMCAVGSLITVRLWRRALLRTAGGMAHWAFLAGMTGGASVWATHFIAMLGHEVDAAVSFDPDLTVFSVVIAIIGIGAGVFVSSLSPHVAVITLGGLIVGASIAAMHYVGMVAYEIAAVVVWDGTTVGVSIACALILGAASVVILARARRRWCVPAATLVLVLAIGSLHFIGMLALSVMAVPGETVVDEEARAAVALAVAVAALFVVGTGLSTHVLTDRTRTSADARLMHQALHDPLTGLPNRRQFHERMANMCRTAASGDGAVTLMVLDLDKFKVTNDVLGHPVGDELLRRIAGRLTAVVGDAGLCARLGGDEFAIALKSGTTVADAQALARALIEILSRPALIDGHVVEVGASVGIAAAPQHGNDALSLIQNADIALYAAKEAGRMTHRVFEPGLMTRAQARRTMEADLRRALARDEFQVHFQPFKDPRTGDFAGAEALLRWEHAERGPVSPAEFVPVAEEMGLIRPIGERVLLVACLAAKQWPDAMHVSVNVSPVQLEDPDFANLVFRTLETVGLPPSRLDLEITETTLLADAAAPKATLAQLHRGGVCITLDDFGTGYSSLTHLSHYPISRLKLDKTFFSRGGDERSQSLVRAIAQFGQNLDIAVTAEGIETDEQSLFATKVGCSLLQGYYHGKPSSAETLPLPFRARAVSRSAA